MLPLWYQAVVVAGLALAFGLGLELGGYFCIQLIVRLLKQPSVGKTWRPKFLGLKVAALGLVGCGGLWLGPEFFWVFVAGACMSALCVGGWVLVTLWKN